MQKYILATASVIILAVVLWYGLSPSTVDDGITTANLSMGSSSSNKLEESARASYRPSSSEAPSNFESENPGEEQLPSDLASSFRGEDNSSQSKEMVDNAIDRLGAAAIANDKNVLNDFYNMDPNCSWCNSFYGSLREKLHSPDIRSDMQAFFADVLARSGKPENLQALTDSMQDALSHPEKGDSGRAYVQALEQTQLPTETVDQLSLYLSSDNPYLREAAVSILTKQGTKEAIARLYQHTLERGDPQGYYQDGMGIGNTKPQPEALQYLEDMARNSNQYSHLAIKALLNSGQEGISTVVTIVNEVKDYATAKKMLQSAVDHVQLDNATVAYIQSLARNSPQKAVQEWAAAVKKEHDIDRQNLTRGIELNENFEKGLVH